MIHRGAGMEELYDLYFKHQGEMICAADIQRPQNTGREGLTVTPEGLKATGGLKGLINSHAYSVLKARKVVDKTGAVHKLIQIRYVVKLRLSHSRPRKKCLPRPVLELIFPNVINRKSSNMKIQNT